MNASKNTRIGALVVGAVALVAAGGAFAAGKHHGSKAAAQGGLSIGSYVSSQAGGTTRNDGRGFGMGRGFGHGPGMGDDLAAAAAYLGVTASDLQASLQSGKTLAQVADATSGKSSADLIAALVSHEQDELAAAVTAGKLTKAQADAIKADLTTRITNLVNGTGPMMGHGFGHGFGPGPGGPPPGAPAGTHI